MLTILFSYIRHIQLE